MRPLAARLFALMSGSSVFCNHCRLLAQVRCHSAVLDARFHLLGNFTLQHAVFTAGVAKWSSFIHLVIASSAHLLFSFLSKMADTKLVNRLLDLSKAGIDVLPLYSRGDTHGRVVSASSFVARKGNLP